MILTVPNSENDIDETLIGEDNQTSGTLISVSNGTTPLIPIDAVTEWKNGPLLLQVPEYLNVPKMSCPIPTSEMEFFKLIITDYIVIFMVQETNRYAKASMENQIYLNFKLITPNEMRKFISIIIYMGICKLPTYEMYWLKTGNVFNQPFINELMKYERFCEIKKYFHVFDKDEFDYTQPSDGIVGKLDGLIKYFNKKFHSIYVPEKELAIDENLCSWSGKGGSKVYMPLKPVKFGMKLYALCEAKSGYACSLILYNSNKKESNIDIIARLTEKYTMVNHNIYMDNFYTSVKVLESLKTNGIYSCGTLRENRGGPKKLKGLIKNFAKGDGILMNNESINYIGFKDNGVVQIISNIHSSNFLGEQPECINGINKFSNIKSNEIIINYNKFMGGVDLMDQMTKYYSIGKKTQKWTTKMVFHLLNISFYNTYVLYKKNNANGKSGLVS